MCRCHEIWEPKPPGTLWATPGLLRGSIQVNSYNTEALFTHWWYRHIPCQVIWYNRYVHWLHVSASNQPLPSNRSWNYEWRGEMFGRRTRELLDEVPWRGISLTYNVHDHGTGNCEITFSPTANVETSNFTCGRPRTSHDYQKESSFLCCVPGESHGWSFVRFRAPFRVMKLWRAPQFGYPESCNVFTYIIVRLKGFCIHEAHMIFK